MATRKTPSSPSLNFSGYLPGEELQGLSTLAEEVHKKATDKRNTKPIEYVVMAVVRATTVSGALPGGPDRAPTYAVTVQTLEVVHDADEAAEVRDRIVALREHRLGVQDAIPDADSGGADVIPLPGD